ncbi:MAG: hypothetical protein KJO45_01315, partial [Sulfurovum sp.]|nr:hypothetical protein [Sulfurovum sp.]
MNKYLKITLISLLMLVIALSGILFTQQGNDLVKPFLKAELEKQVGLPVDVNLYKLRYDNTELKITIDNALNVDVESIFNLLGLSFDGIYTIYANNFVYNGINLKQANINGEFKGVPDDLYVNGKGNTFNAPLNYYLRVLEGDAKEVTIQLKDMNISDMLALAKQPAVANGKVDANVTIPTMAEGELNAHGIIHFNGMSFNDALIKKLYKVSMPEAMKVDGIVDANVTDTEIIGGADMKSNILNVNLQNAQFNTKTKYLSSDYMVDILNLKSLSDMLRTKLDGALVLEGHVEKDKILNLTGVTRSLGGEINYTLLDKNLSSSIVAVPVKNMLQMFRFPAFVDAHASGALGYDLLSKKGHTKLALEKFKLASNKMTKSVKMMILKDPSSIVFGDTSLDAAMNGDNI